VRIAYSVRRPCNVSLVALLDYWAACSLLVTAIQKEATIMCNGGNVPEIIGGEIPTVNEGGEIPV
jgi:hypothetical protein